jgi:ATP-dependent Zn protease
MDDCDELTAYHEAGHALMAIALGGQILHVSIEPNKDDGPQRFGESIVKWPVTAREQIELFEIQVSLAGPIAEMTYSGEIQSIGSVQEFADDWQRCLAHAAVLKSTVKEQLILLVQVQASLFKFFESENSWAAVSAIADELLAHETIEHECIAEIATFWNIIGN